MESKRPISIASSRDSVERAISSHGSVISTLQDELSDLSNEHGYTSSKLREVDEGLDSVQDRIEQCEVTQGWMRCAINENTEKIQEKSVELEAICTQLATNYMSLIIDYD